MPKPFFGQVSTVALQGKRVDSKYRATESDVPVVILIVPKHPEDGLGYVDPRGSRIRTT